MDGPLRSPPSSLRPFNLVTDEITSRNNLGASEMKQERLERCCPAAAQGQASRQFRQH